MRFLIVDDHEVVRRGLHQLLAREYPDGEFKEAATAQAALEAMARAPWQLVLLDINLPGASGLELLVQAKKLYPAMPVLVLSAYSEEEFAIRAFKLGAAGYLTKWSLSDEMLLAVRCVLDGRKYVSASLAQQLASTLGGNPTQALHEALSQRELEVLRMVAKGRTIKDIASELLLSEKTIATYRARACAKLGWTTNVELARYALQNGLVD